MIKRIRALTITIFIWLGNNPVRQQALAIKL